MPKVKDMEVTSDKYFYMRCGRALKTYSEFKQFIKDLNENKITDDVSRNCANFHINNGNNDYANWLEGVFFEKELATKIRFAKNYEELFKIIGDYEKDGSEAPEKKLEVKEEKNKDEKAKKEEKLEIKEENVVDANNPNKMPKKYPEFDKEVLEKDVHKYTEDSDVAEEKIKKMKIRSRIDKKEADMKVADFKEMYVQLNNKISEARKQKYDVFLPMLKMRQLRPKIEFYEFSQNNEDRKKIMSLIDEIKKEIEDELKQEYPDLKTEVLAGAGLLKKKTEEES